MFFYLYILYSQSIDKYYVGQTENVEKRLSEHIIRKNLGASDWQLKYKEQFPSRSEAVKRESEIKRKKSRRYIEELLKGSNI
ncbi:MAG TPA: GIY-YIG nuclease family protein [Bacteroidia bacterium]|nr:GIY-YIG nuclease family protein [Bacteroidia bacterium]